MPDVRRFRSQAAMEYLMTYGWSILIIAVVLGALFSLGVFSSASLGPRAQPGNCRIVRLAGEANPEGVCQGELPEFVGQFNGNVLPYSYINLGSGINSQFTSQVTVSAWIRQTRDTQGEWYIMSNDRDMSPPGGGFNLRITGSYILQGEVWEGSVSTNTMVIADGATVPQGAWQQVALTFNGIQLTIYQNGLQTGSTTISPNTIQASSLSMTIGALAYGAPSWYRFYGGISNVQIYNTSLDANQINALYLEGIGGAPVDPYHIVGWWPLNGDVNDYSGNNNAGTPTNVVYNSQWTSSYTPP